jgi:imidazolonepropionase-like amidohydrolase
MITLLRNVNLVDVVNYRIKEKANILIDRDTIVDIFYTKNPIGTDQYKLIDLEGCFAMPGLIDLHTHLIWSAGNDPVRTVEEEGIQVSLLRAAFNARKTLESGITCVRDLGSNDNTTVSLSTAVSHGYTLGPRIISSGCTIIMTGGHDPFWGEQVDGEAELIKAVRKQILKGAKVIKISATGGVYGQQEGEDVGTAELTCDEIKVVCDEAHRFGLKVAAHAISEKGIWNCIEAGIDTIEHGHFLTETAMEKMKEKSMYWVPTLYVYRQIANGKDLPLYAVKKAKKIIDVHRKSFKTALVSGVSIACGSDAGSPNTPHGSLINELEYMVEYGSEPFKTLKAATFTAAQALGLERDIGSLEIGKKADILILSKNPIENISNIRELRFVIKGGDFIQV